jgi:hypothetical protein
MSLRGRSVASTPYGGGPGLTTMAAGAAPRRRGKGAARAARCQPAGRRHQTTSSSKQQPHGALEKENVTKRYTSTNVTKVERYKRKLEPSDAMREWVEGGRGGVEAHPKRSVAVGGPRVGQYPRRSEVFGIIRINFIFVLIILYCILYVLRIIAPRSPA